MVAAQLLCMYLSTALARVSAWWWGVHLGTGSRFWGSPLWRRFPKSSIRIGPLSEFRSSPRSNPLGLTRRCIVWTASENASVTIGRECGFSGTVIAGARSIELGNRVWCGANVTITDSDWHPLDAEKRLARLPGRAVPVVIEDDVFLGMNVTVLGGVTIGMGTVVGANSVVASSLPAGAVAAGAPARVIRWLGPIESDVVATLRSNSESGSTTTTMF
jgi:acetyltransferase-like isoleucine patch superfamily enzyme